MSKPRYLVHYESSTGISAFSIEAHDSPWQAQQDAQLFKSDGYDAKVLRVSVDDDGNPVAQWMAWPDPGLYRVHWMSGGSSVAAVGVTEEGDRWLAPTNWIKPSTPYLGWGQIERLELLVAHEPEVVDE